MSKKDIVVIDILYLLVSKINTIIMTTFIALILGSIYIFFVAQPVYTSKSKIVSSSSKGQMSQASGIAAQFGIALPSTDSDDKLVYPDIIKSKILAESLLEKKFDTKRFGNQKSLLQILTYGNDVPQYGLDTLKILATDLLLGMIQVSKDFKTSVLTIYVDAPEAKLAYSINNALIYELDKYQNKKNKIKTNKTRLFIEGRIQETEAGLKVAEEKLKNFRDRNRRMENSPNLLLEQQRLAREVTVQTGVYTTLKQQLETTKIEEVKESNYVLILDPPNNPLFRSRPKRKLFLSIVMIFGIIGGVSKVLLSHYLSQNDRKKQLFQLKQIFIKNTLGKIKS